MSQATPTIGANQSGLAYRTADNDAKSAIITNHSGSSAPSYVTAGMHWLDTSATPWLIKMYDGTDHIVIGAVNASTNTFTPYYGAAEPRYINHATDTGSANAYAIAPSPAIPAYVTGQVFLLKPANANTGSSTLAVNGLTAITIKTRDGNNIPARSLITSHVAILMYDGTNMIYLNQPPYMQGSDIASASTLNLDTATGDYVHVTGTTTITAITLAKGKQSTTVFDGALTLTNGASLINVTAANITTASGDVAVWRGEASGVVRMVSYTRANGNALNIGTSGATVPLLNGNNTYSGTATFSSTVTISTGSISGCPLKAYYSATVADDAATNFTMPNTNGHISFGRASASFSYSGRAQYSTTAAGGTDHLRGLDGGTLVAINATAGTLTGTTGTDGFVTARMNGTTTYLENRSGSSATLYATIVGN